MSANPLVQVANYGQSIWLDQMRRSLLTSGELKKLIDEDGLRGLTSNPTIFEKAIAGSQDYVQQLTALAQKGASVSEMYEDMVVEDIGNAADLFRGVYDKANGKDGFVSLEVSPLLANNTEATVKEGKSLFQRLGRPNVMIKVPATPAGLPAIEEMIAAGLNINVTLIFSVEVYEQVVEAYIRGLERRVALGQPIDRIASVASFFVSRIDSAVDKQLEALLAKETDPQRKEEIRGLLGKAAIANAKWAYRSFKKIFGGERFAKLKQKGAQVQRPLWASTSTKNPNYRDVLYVESLIGTDTVDTVPPQTIDAFRDHGKPAATLEQGMDQVDAVFAGLKKNGVDFDKVTEQLTLEGVKSFADSFNQLTDAIQAQRDKVTQGAASPYTENLGSYDAAKKDALKKLVADQFVEKVWKKDASAWNATGDHLKLIPKALGWLTVPELVNKTVGDLKNFAKEIAGAGFKHVMVLGMGGSSLCPEVLARTFGKQPGYPQLLVLDSTVPATVRRLDEQIDVTKTLFIVASKSGTTTEPQMFYRYYFDRVKQKLGEKAGNNFIAITDPGTQLDQEARRDKFRRVFLNPADIGGRYSALSYFGMVPFALMGGDVETFLNRAVKTSEACKAKAETNPGLQLGAAMGALALKGRNKITFVAAAPLDSVGLWIEQLIAESTGKEGKGIVPVAGELLASPDQYGQDRVFVYIGTSSAPADVEAQLKALETSGHPVIRHVLRDPLDLGQEFFVWEFATATAGALLGIDPFDQPNVQESKDNTKRLLAEFEKNGKLQERSLLLQDKGVRILTDEGNLAALGSAKNSFEQAIHAHLDRVKAGDYVALTEYVDETPIHDSLLSEIRTAIRSYTKAATTTGYGPRFLHSTGQLHKGGANNGVFIQITSADALDVPLPGEPFTFGILKQAQAIGDFESLSKRIRRAVCVDLGNDVELGLRRILAAVQSAGSRKATPAEALK